MDYVSHPLIFPETVEDRLYQRKIVEAAKERNTLVVLPTALGKTVISALVAADILYNFRDYRVLVMAPTRPLCMQHKSTFEKIIMLPDEDFTLVTGRFPQTFRESVWRGSSRIVFATPQVVKNDLLSKILDLRNFGLLVFDEAHRAVKEYAYTEIARQYVDSAEYPLILGMTASPGSDIERVKMVCNALYIEHIEFRSEEDDDVKPYIQPVKVEWKRVNFPIQYQPIRDILYGMLYDRIRWLKDRGYLKSQIENVSRKRLIELGAELRYNVEMSIEEERGPIYHAIMVQSSALTLYHMLELLETQGAYTLKAFIEKMEEDCKASHGLLEREKAYNEILSLLSGPCNIEHPKVNMLKEIVREQLYSNPASRILVFTQYRDTATHLVEELNRIEHVRAKRFVGQATRAGDRGLRQEEQAQLIEELRKGEINVLVATSIAEEGLDIPEVNQVIFYEPIPSEIRYIQRRGRTGRRTPGKVTILATEDTHDIIYLYTSTKKVAKMKEIASKLNTILTPILRTKQKPAPNPITREEVAKIKRTVQPLKEMEKLREYDRQVEKATRTLYQKILEKGIMGIEEEQLYKEMEEEGYSRSITKAALTKLVKARHLENRGSVKVPLKNVPGAKIFEIEIEKIMPGEAIVLVEGKWYAKLSPENYNGPKQLIRKGAHFKAQAQLFHQNGKLHIRIWQILQTL
ncbi:MAG: helicase-related protein [Nitrososphaeria archaeon]